MGDVFERPYIPQINKSSTEKHVYNLKDYYRDNQSYSRDKHNKKRAAIHRLKKKKESLINVYNNKPLFIFKLLNDNIQIIDNAFKNKLNNLLENYERSTLSIRNCKNEESLEILCKKLNKMCENIENQINKNNFISILLKGYFINKDEINLRDDPEYKELIKIYKLQENELQKKKKEELDKYSVKQNFSFADVLKKNIK